MKFFRLHYLFLAEFFLVRVRLDRGEQGQGLFENLKIRAKLVLKYLRESLIIAELRRRLVAILISQYCSPVHSEIFFVANYGVDNSVLPKGRRNIALCFGLHDTAAFELCLARELGVEVYACDPTPISVKKFSNDYAEIPGFNFLPYALSSQTKEIEFFLANDMENSPGSLVTGQKNAKKISVAGITVRGLVETLGTVTCDLLKLDIDGGEIDIILSIVSRWDADKFPRQITMELDVTPDTFKEIYSFLRKMSRDYSIYYIPHKQRYSSLELLFVRKVLC